MTIEYLSPRGDEPIPLADAKAWLRVDHAFEDSLIASLLESARAGIEHATGQALVTRHIRETLVAPLPPPGRHVAGGGVRLAFAPLLSLVAIELVAPDGSVEALPVAGFRLDAEAGIVFSPTLGPPFPAEDPGPGASVRIEARFGYQSPSLIPAPLREAILRLTAAAFESRGARPPDSASLVGDLIAPWRRIRL